MKKSSLIALFALFSAGFASAQTTPPVQTVAAVDLTQYAGLWYEVASIPQHYQKKCMANVMAEYTLLDNGEIEVYNACEKYNGEMVDVKGRGKVVDSITNAKLKVTFVKIFDWIYAFGGDYWIIDLAADYSYAVVGSPDRKSAWILSRTPVIDVAKLKLAYDNLTAQKFDTCKVLTTIQNGGFTQRRPLCEFVQ